MVFVIPTKMWTYLLLFSCASYIISTIELTPEKLETGNPNTKYIKYINATFRKNSRKSPYYLTVEFYAFTGYGNNLTLQWILYEYLSGHYIRTPLQFEYKFCDFLYKDPYIGQMFAAQLPVNWTCPFPAGKSTFKNLEINANKLPFIPFTYSSLTVRTRIDLHFLLTSTKEPIASIQLHLKVTQKLKSNIKS